MELSDLGLDSWFKERKVTQCSPYQSVARVVAVDRDRMIVRDGEGEFSAELLGKFFYKAARSAEFPCVGDWVCLERHDADPEHSSNNTFASIDSILPRKTLLKRKTVGYDDEFQLLAANVDVAFIVMSCDYDFHVNKLERFLVMIREGHVEPVLLITKTDLMHPEDLEFLIEDVHDAGIKIKIMTLSNATGEGLEEVKAFIQPAKTYCLLGSSGVGKSSLMNQLLGEQTFETQPVSASGEGRHTTVRRHLVVLNNGGMMVDMPGMRELAVAEVSEGIEESFEDILEIAELCRFSNCGHSNEPGCAIIEAIENDELDIEHFDNYLKIQKESGHHKKAIYAEKRKKGKNASRIAPSKARHKKLRVSDKDLES